MAIARDLRNSKASNNLLPSSINLFVVLFFIKKLLYPDNMHNVLNIYWQYPSYLCRSVRSFD